MLLLLLLLQTQLCICTIIIIIIILGLACATHNVPFSSISIGENFQRIRSKNLYITTPLISQF